MKAVVAAFNQEKALVGAFSVITSLRMDLFEALVSGLHRDNCAMCPGNSTQVLFHVTVMSLDTIDESSMTYTCDIFFAQSWKDYR